MRGEEEGKCTAGKAPHRPYPLILGVVDALRKQGADAHRVGAGEKGSLGLRLRCVVWVKQRMYMGEINIYYACVYVSRGGPARISNIARASFSLFLHGQGVPLARLEMRRVCGGTFTSSHCNPLSLAHIFSMGKVSGIS